jgi:predicted amidohydrolase
MIQDGTMIAVAQIEPRPGRLLESVAAHVRMAARAADRGARLVVFPELSLTGYTIELTRADAIDLGMAAIQLLVVAARKHDVVIVTGAPLDSPEGLLIGNLAFHPDGAIRTYTKQHLHPGEERTFVVGHGGAHLAVAGANVAMAICAEINHASHVAGAVAGGADVYAASCFLTPRGYTEDCARLKSYAVAHRVPVLMANFGGPCGGFEAAGGSAIWDDAGRLLATAPPSGEWIVSAQRQAARWTGSVHSL